MFPAPALPGMTRNDPVSSLPLHGRAASDAAPALATQMAAPVATIASRSFMSLLIVPPASGAEGAGTLPRQHTYGGAMVSTWSVLRQSCKPRSPVGLVKQPEQTQVRTKITSHSLPSLNT